MAQYPYMPIPNPYQIAGEAASKLGQQVGEFGQTRDALQERFRLMMEKRAEAALLAKQRETELQIKQAEADRAAEKDKREREMQEQRMKFLSRKPSAEGVSAYSEPELKEALASGIIDAPTFKALQPKEPERFSAGGGYYEIGPDGKPKQIVAPKPESNDTRWQVINTPQGVFQVNPETGESRRVEGVLGKGQTPIQTVVDKGAEAINVIEQMVGRGKPGSPDYLPPHPGFTSAVGVKGLSSGFGLMDTPYEGSPASDFVALQNQIGGKAFLEAFESLKGGGHITEIEGIKATQAITRMTRAQSEAEFMRAANEFKDAIRRGLERAKKQYGVEPNTQLPPYPSGSSGDSGTSVGRFKVRVK